MLKLAVCENNPVHFEMITDLIKQHLKSDFEITAFSSGSEFLSSLSDLKFPFDIVLLDINLGANSVSGISIAEKINQINSYSRIIFISQYLEYASAVYETDHVYFVSKKQLNQYLPKALDAAMAALTSIQSKYLCFSWHSREYRVSVTDIQYMERNLRNTEIHTDTQTFTSNEKLQQLVSRMQPDFCICHKSYAVNLHKIQSFSHNGITLNDEIFIPVSRSCYKQTQEALAGLMYIPSP